MPTSLTFRLIWLSARVQYSKRVLTYRLVLNFRFAIQIDPVQSRLQLMATKLVLSLANKIQDFAITYAFRYFTESVCASVKTSYSSVPDIENSTLRVGNPSQSVPNNNFTAKAQRRSRWGRKTNKKRLRKTAF
ncbi:hypothetical protein TIFTF001_000732 [Ficus carica]|uniref:Uncharacterized protein n=1 Tax=Ficus carica TaxID=3494 RepID=A0AA88D284_FICCA|nr:hypothetical protein TIFTF001_000732 [Ficus carica]